MQNRGRQFWKIAIANFGRWRPILEDGEANFGRWRNQFWKMCDYRTDDCNPICPGVSYEAPDVMLSVSLFFKRAHSGLLKSHKTPQKLCCLMPNTTVQYQSNYIIAMIVSREWPGDYRFLLCAQRIFCIKPKKDHLGRVHSDQMVLVTIRQGRLVR